jgi:hypothetical protein
MCLEKPNQQSLRVAGSPDQFLSENFFLVDFTYRMTRSHCRFANSFERCEAEGVSTQILKASLIHAHFARSGAIFGAVRIED